MQMKQDIPNYRDFVHSPSRSVSHALQEFKRRQNANYRLTWGVKNIDEYLIPMMDGDLISLLARPGHAKTSTLIHLARRGSQACHELAEQGTGYDKIVVYATWETTIEEFIGLLTANESGQTLEDIARGRADLEKIRDVAVGNIGNRIYIIGKSSKKPSHTPITLDVVDYILRDLAEEGKHPLMVCADYLQKIPAARSMPKNERVEMNVGLLKDLGLNHGCPVGVAVQASREADDQNDLRLPTMSMAQWASAIEQDSDKIISQTRPIMYMQEGSEITQSENGSTVVVTENLMVYRVIKQRWGRVGKTFFAHLDPSTITISNITEEENIGF